MKRITITLALSMLILIPALAAKAQTTTFTGTAVIYGMGRNTRTITRTFTLRINDITSDSEANRILSVLADDGQDALLRSIDDKELGRFSLGANVGVPVNAVLVDKADGQTRIRVIFARWIGFGELRYGRRSVDYPFSYLELLIDPRTGEGEGTYFQAARIRSRGGNTIEVEDFGTFPSRLMGVRMRGRPLS